MCNHMQWLSLAILLTGLTMIGSQTSGTGDATLAPTELPQAPPTTIPPPPRPSTAPILPPITPSPRQDRLTTTTPRDRVNRQAPVVTPSLCTFGRRQELSACNWNMTAVDADALDWRLSSGRAAFFRGGPAMDANGDAEGGYVLVETSQPVGAKNLESVAFLPSNLLNSTPPDGRCVTFQYAMDGPSAERIRLLLHPVESSSLFSKPLNDSTVYILVGQHKETLWENRGDTGDQWRSASVLYGFGLPHYLTFEAMADDSVGQRKLRGHVAIDNVDLGTWRDSADAETVSPEVQASLLVNPCLGHCNFDGGFCGWSNGQDADFDWKLGRGSTSSVTGPSRDHNNFVSGSPSRGYAFIDSGYPRRPGDRARLVSPQMTATQPDQPLCLRFWTHMYGNGIGSLKVILMSNAAGLDPTSRDLWNLNGESGNSWHQAAITIASAVPFQIVLEAAVGRNNLGDISVDDVSFNLGSCPSAPQTAAHHQGDCNFEADECGWSNVGSRELLDDIDWSRVPAENSRQQPVKDHTTYTGKGYVMIPMRSTVQRPGDRAWLVSRPFNVTSGQTDNRCLTFWYFLNEPIIDPAGPSLGSLRVYVRREDATNNQQQAVIWRLHNHQGSGWKLGQANIQQTGSYRVILEGLWGSSRSAGSIAIDDISFYEGTCTTRPDQALPMGGECSFDRDTCGWRSVTNATALRPDIDWRLASLSRRPANLPDHTFGAPSGYVYFDVFSQQGRLEVVRLQSPNMTLSTTDRPRLCLTFWFAAFGAGDSTQLKILTVDSESRAEREIWMLRVGQLESLLRSSDWNFGQVELEQSNAVNGTLGRNIHLVFEGRASNGGFAVDDVYIYQGGCLIRPASALPNN